MEIVAKKPTSLFISYAREDDEPFVEKLYQDLKEKGFEIWWDRAAMKNRGRTFLQEIRDAIEDSDLLIAVIGPKAIESDSVRYEWEHALLFSKGVIPVLRMGDYNLLLPEMSKLHCPDFREKRPYEEALEELIRLLKEPIPPLGPIIGVPSLPPNHLPRKNDLNIIKEIVLTDTIKPVVITSTKQVTALQGMGGMGKSVLAAAFARSVETRRAFYDGIFWITVGLEASDSDASGNMRLIGTNLGDDPVNYSSKKEAEASLSKVLSDKVCLIILDDVWKVPQATPFFNALGSRCRLLITTRNDDVVTSLGAQEHKIKVLNKPEALKLLANWCEEEVDSLSSEATEVVRECGCLPLALSICGAMAKSGISWTYILEALQEADLEFIEAQLPNYPDPNVGRALKVSVDFLSLEDPNAVMRYQELVIFPEDELVPETTIAMLWEHTGNLKRRNVEKLLTKLKDRSLLRLDGEAPNLLISLHDLQLDYLRVTVGDLTSLHNKLLAAYGKECGNKWSNGSEDGYFFEHLAYHMKEAGRREELHKLLLDFEWMCKKIKCVRLMQEKDGKGIPDLNSLLHDYEFLSNEPEIELVKEAIQLSFDVIAKDEAQFSGQLIGRLQVFNQNEEIRLLLDQATQWKEEDVRLIPLQPCLKPPGGSLKRTFKAHAHPINDVVITSNGKVAISASTDKTIRIWDLNEWIEKGTLKGHLTPVTAIAVSLDGKYAASCSYHIMCLIGDNNIKVWDLEKREEKTTLKGHTHWVQTVAITPDGKYIVSGSLDKTIKIWDLETGKEKTTLVGHEGPVDKIVITPNGKYVLSTSSSAFENLENSLHEIPGDNTIKVWDLEKGEEMATLRGHEKVFSIAVTPNGKYAVSGSHDGTLKVWDLEKWREIRSLRAHSKSVTAFAITSDGKLVVLGSLDGNLKVWNLETGEEKAALKEHSEPITEIVITPDCKRAVSGSSDNTLKVWDLEKMEELTTLIGHSNSVSKIAITPSGKYAISGSSDNTLKVWDLKKLDEETISTGHSKSVNKIVITPDGKLAVSSSYDGTLKVWDLKTKEEKVTLKGHSGPVTDFVITPDGKRIISGSSDKTLRVWDLKKGNGKMTLKGHKREVTSVAITSDGKYAISGSFDRTIKVWDLETGKIKVTLEGHKNYISTISIIPNKNCIVSSSHDETLKVWDLDREIDKITLIGHSGSISSVAITPDGKSIVSASGDGTHKIWSLENREEIATLEGHKSAPSTIVITPDGKYAVSASYDRTIKILDLKKQIVKTSLRGHTDSATLVAVTSNSRYVVSASRDNTLRVWDLESSSEVSCFTGDVPFTAFDILKDENIIVVGDSLGKVYFFHLHIPCKNTFYF